MKKLLFFSLAGLAFLYACKKEDKNQGDPHAGDMVTHYTYIKGMVVDSATGAPVPGATVYYSGGGLSPMSGGLSVTDAGGRYVRTLAWYTGRPYAGGPIVNQTPPDSANEYVSAYTNTGAKQLLFRGAQLRENDTATLADIRLKPLGYIKIHVKDIPGYSDYGSELECQNTMGPFSMECNIGWDTIIFRKVFPDFKVHLLWTITSSLNGNDSAFIRSGDTASFDVFY